MLINPQNAGDRAIKARACKYTHTQMHVCARRHAKKNFLSQIDYKDRMGVNLIFKKVVTAIWSPVLCLAELQARESRDHTSGQVNGLHGPVTLTGSGILQCGRSAGQSTRASEFRAGS